MACGAHCISYVGLLQQMPSVKYYTKFLTSDMHSARGCASKLHAKLTPGWVLIQVNFDPIQEKGPEVGSVHSFPRLWYVYVM